MAKSFEVQMRHTEKAISDSEKKKVGFLLGEWRRENKSSPQKTGTLRTVTQPSFLMIYPEYGREPPDSVI
jgi:hypothetical protein